MLELLGKPHLYNRLGFFYNEFQHHTSATKAFTSTQQPNHDLLNRSFSSNPHLMYITGNYQYW
jgi:hypothetical protein